jgi:hypothetical protein
MVQIFNIRSFLMYTLNKSTTFTTANIFHKSVRAEMENKLFGVALTEGGMENKLFGVEVTKNGVALCSICKNFSPASVLLYLTKTSII